MVERDLAKVEVAGSSPVIRSKYTNKDKSVEKTDLFIDISKKDADLAHLVERDLAKVEVAGSSPVIRSIFGAIAKW